MCMYIVRVYNILSLLLLKSRKCNNALVIASCSPACCRVLSFALNHAARWDVPRHARPCPVHARHKVCKSCMGCARAGGSRACSRAIVGHRGCEAVCAQQTTTALRGAVDIPHSVKCAGLARGRGVFSSQLRRCRLALGPLFLSASRCRCFNFLIFFASPSPCVPPPGLSAPSLGAGPGHCEGSIEDFLRFTAPFGDVDDAAPLAAAPFFVAMLAGSGAAEAGAAGSALAYLRSLQTKNPSM
mmetsp:Transcript_36645/g.96729  ORF Transcript_36645/g.96729 Transcript_36645/m.96729 type:complete len:242 (-) Transcript_36645:11-736(-)